MQTLKLIYCFDALCGWCFGFSPQMKIIAQHYQDKMQVEVISGGMILGPREGPIGQVAPYIKSAYKTVEERTGVKFGEAFLTDILAEGNAIFSSQLPAQALSWIKLNHPELSLKAAHLLHSMIYVQGLAPNNIESYQYIAENLNIDANSMMLQMQLDEIKMEAQRDFQWVANAGINGFPALILQVNDQYFMVARGYTKAQDVMDVIERIITQ